ncbi:MAG: RNA polymerase sigma factor [Bacteroidia bacterium]|nr:RNA polymerase sigma factor [Bacteroidia bacterium]
MKAEEQLIKLAIQGDKDALEQLLISVEGMIYNLALRMLWHPEDAKDATQEILIKVLTNLGSFKYQSGFKTWVYKLSTNNLINFKKRIQTKKLSFEAYSGYLNQGLSDGIHYTDNEVEQNLLIVEAKVGCSNAMLQCLNATNRLVYIIGEILELNSREAAFIMETTPVNFRKRLSNSRKKLHAFIHRNCGIVNPSNPCRCHKKVDDAIENNRINPEKLLFTKTERTEQLIVSISSIQDEVGLYQSNPDYQSPDEVLGEIKRIINTTDNV